MDEINKFELPSLPYDYDALEPFIDEETLHYHHDKHHKTYAEKLSVALENYHELQQKKIEELLKNPEDLPLEIRKPVINNGGGYYNHNLYFESLSPTGGEPKGELLNQINADFGNLDTLKKDLAEAAANQFGSGYGWLVKDSSGHLKIYSLANQDSPISVGDTPLLPLDVWEHAYYLKYKNARAEYLSNIWNIIDWQRVYERFMA